MEPTPQIDAADPTANPSRRRVLLSALAAAGGATIGASPLLRAAQEEAESSKDDASKRLAPKSKILFQGDSITDAGRNRGDKGANSAGAMGRGYPFLIASYLLATRPKDALEIYNRGISGNKVPDLDKRWKEDTIDIAPDLLSILIGVNDIWHKLNGGYDGTVESYEKGFADLLERTKEALPKTRIVVCEPFVLRTGAVNDKWFPEFDERRKAAKRVAEKAEATFVEFQTMFDEAVKEATPGYWAGDGVHPSMAGHALMAMYWVEQVKP